MLGDTGWDNPSLRERLDRSIVSKIIGTKMQLGMGLGGASTQKKTLKWSDQLAEELHKPVSRKFQRRRVQVIGIDEIWAADLIDMQAFSKFNRGVKYLLAVIDIILQIRMAYTVEKQDGEGCENKTIYLCGDFNIDLLQSDKNNYISNFIDHLYSMGLHPLITRHTRITCQSKTLIDNIFK